MSEVILICAIALFLGYFVGKYMIGVFSDQKHWSDKVFSPLENVLIKLIGIKASSLSNWKGYVVAFIVSNFAIGVTAYLLFYFQHVLPMNPDNIGPLSWDLALHTMVSFLTNTNQQHYSGQAQLSYLSQGFTIVTLQFVTPAMGIALCVAILRAMKGGLNHDAEEGSERTLGNFYVDTLKALTRVLIPLALLSSISLTSQGVPSTFSGAQVSDVVDKSTAVTEQVIPVGPVSAMVAIKQLGTNGGGWFGPNSTNPLENPTPVSNVIETISLVLIPIAIVFMAGGILKDKRFTYFTLAIMGLMSVLLISASVYSERLPNVSVAQAGIEGPNMEGKEVRFGTDVSALWATLTTQTSNGSVNAMHDSLNPIAGFTTRTGMLIGSVWGGIGGGLVNFLVYLWIGVFIAGLLIGRTPEFLGKKIETKEVTLLSLLIITPTVIVLGLTALTVAFPSIAGTTNPGFHAISQVFYEYTSAFANNGSGFEGLNDDSIWWNVTCVIALIAGRYIPFILPMMIAGSLAKKKMSPKSSGTLNIYSPVFAVTVFAVIVIINVLSFLPAAVIGPVGEAMSLGLAN
ncbi:potassium-transporting ATPase subunit KdpA [Salinivibrio sp. MA351]|uniref:potassium-transporting ATPase subunit KdpA n=1 Tax=Salinivibrio sp. MA351 TaxID=1909453 RepID=UPI00098914B0|nr:potassium-transporting ATPase subunit KdpA [Salinivibrio sp. MA351]OOE96270.1 potassium-transporting ATPase subunit KdpA [Salinivibrio sp. MA351]